MFVIYYPLVVFVTKTKLESYITLVSLIIFFFLLGRIGKVLIFFENDTLFSVHEDVFDL